MSLIVHIGMQKTGSTFLQQAIHSRRTRLRTLGLNYVHGMAGVARRSPNHHHWLAHSILDKRYGYTPDADFSNLDAHLEAITASVAKAKTSLLSSEDFSNFSADQVNRFGDILPDDTRILVYFRRQDYWFDALFAQLLKVGRKVDFDSLLKTNQNRLDHMAFLAPWAERFGAENIIVRPYEGFDESLDLWKDFFKAIDLPGLGKVVPSVGANRTNVSLSPALTEIARLLSPLGANGALRPYMEYANAAASKDPALKILSAQQAAEIMDTYGESSNEAARTYMGSGTLFMDQTPARSGRGEELSAQQMAVALGGIIAKLAQENRELAAKVERLEKPLQSQIVSSLKKHM